jgi:hypothetical protein
MSTDLKDINIKALPEQLSQLGKKLNRFRVILFVIFVAGVYGYISYQIFTLSNPSTDTSDVDTQVTNLTPHIDIKVVDQLESLKDNSVNVKTLFEDARQNPFAE